MKRISKGLLVAAIAGAMSSGGVAPTASAPTVEKQSSNISQKQQATKRTSSHAIKVSAAIRETGRYSGYSWLIPVNKESFKQSRRKQLKLRSKKKAKRNGQA